MKVEAPGKHIDGIDSAPGPFPSNLSYIPYLELALICVIQLYMSSSSSFNKNAATLHGSPLTPAETGP